MNPLAIAALVAEFLPTVKSIIDVAESNQNIYDKIKALGGPIVTFLETEGAKLFPSASPVLQVVGAVVAGFDPNTTKWLQNSLNTILAHEVGYVPLVVDGIYGSHTAAAVTQLQTKYKLTVDGIAGTITQAAISAVLANLPNLPALPPAPATA